MPRLRRPAKLSLLFAVLAAGLLTATAALAQPAAVPVGGFHFELEAPVPGSPEAAFAAWTGETLSWWDHRFSEHPAKLYFDTKPGGGFWEIFDAAGHGVQHAVVNYVDPPKMLRFTGPLGLSGHALEMVHTVTFTAEEGGRTRIKLSVNGAGELEPAWPQIIEKTWRHFLLERFVPYMEAKAKKP